MKANLIAVLKLLALLALVAAITLGSGAPMTGWIG